MHDCLHCCRVVSPFGRATPGDDASFGWSWNQTADEFGAAVDGEGATGIYASGEAP